MRKERLRALAALAVLGIAGCRRPSPWVRIPEGEAWLGSAETRETHPPRRAAFSAFLLGRRPVTVSDYLLYLADRGAEAVPPADPAVRRARGQWACARGTGRRPITGLTRAEAEDYCRWLSRNKGVRARLPFADEWEYAARGGIDGARYPWGWGSPPRRSMANEPFPVGRPQNPYGLAGLVGYVFQWCADSCADGGAIACGGSWAEQDPRFLRVFHRTVFPADYRGRDMGFRVLVELRED
jgi:formylglycine-generating enzyme required for sulfatase activity